MVSKFTQETDQALLSSIEDNSVSFVLTDPPYIISKKSGMQSLLESGGSSEKYGTKYAFQTDYGDWDKNYTIDDLRNAIKHFYRILKPGGSCVIFFDLWKLETLSNCLKDIGFSKLRMIEWLKTNPVPVNSKVTYLNNAREIAISCIKGSNATFNNSYDNGVYQYPSYSGKERFHPTQKPISLFEDLILKHTNKGDVVVDPYAGSGTTYCACLKTDRVCISCEPNEEYFLKTKNRIKNYESVSLM